MFECNTYTGWKVATQTMSVGCLLHVRAGELRGVSLSCHYPVPPGLGILGFVVDHSLLWLALATPLRYCEQCHSQIPAHCQSGESVVFPRQQRHDSEGWWLLLQQTFAWEGILHGILPSDPCNGQSIWSHHLVCVFMSMRSIWKVRKIITIRIRNYI